MTLSLKPPAARVVAECMVSDCRTDAYFAGCCLKHLRDMPEAQRRSLVAETHFEPGVCRRDGCEDKADVRGLCRLHYGRAHRAETLDLIALTPQAPPKKGGMTKRKSAPAKTQAKKATPKPKPTPRKAAPKKATATRPAKTSADPHGPAAVLGVALAVLDEEIAALQRARERVQKAIEDLRRSP